MMDENNWITICESRAFMNEFKIPLYPHKQGREKERKKFQKEKGKGEGGGDKREEENELLFQGGKGLFSSSELICSSLTLS